MSQELKMVLVLQRRINFENGSSSLSPLGVFHSKESCERAIKLDLQRMEIVFREIKPMLGALNIASIQHCSTKVPMEDDGGIVLASANTPLPPPPAAS